MKKELFAVCLLLVILAAALLNIHFLGRLSSQLNTLVTGAEDAALADNWPQADTLAAEAANLWSRESPYTEIVLRHSEIDAATDALFELAGAIASQDKGSVSGAAMKLRAHLDSIAAMEKIRFGSVF